MDKEIIEIAHRYADKVTSRIPVRMIVLYGSYARGRARASSDIDIAVVVDKIPRDYLQTSADLFALVRGVDKRIEPVLVCPARDKSGFLAGIMKHGKIIYRSAN